MCDNGLRDNLPLYLIEVSPKYVEIWDTGEDGYAFQLFLDFEKKSVEVKQYDAF